jgi:hypothetical protein
VHLAAYLDPARPSLVRRRDDFASWALIAVLGFGLLIPLQGYTVWRGLTTANAAQKGRLGAISGRLTALRQAISTAPTTQELQRRLAAVKAPPLDAEDLAQPLPQLRRSMLASLEHTQNQARDRLGGIPATGGVAAGPGQPALGALLPGGAAGLCGVHPAPGHEPDPPPAMAGLVLHPQEAFSRPGPLRADAGQP